MKRHFGNSLAERGRDLAKAEYSWAKMADRQEEIYCQAEARSTVANEVSQRAGGQPELS